MAEADLLIRPAGPDDLAEVAEVMLASRQTAYPSMPASIHTDDEVRAFVAGWDLARRDVWVAEAGESVTGFVALLDDWVDFLFVHPTAAGQGVGSALVDLAKSLRPDGFGLWVFSSNAPARAFYARHGLVEVEQTDGSDNEERQPDVRMAWSGR